MRSLARAVSQTPAFAGLRSGLRWQERPCHACDCAAASNRGSIVRALLMCLAFLVGWAASYASGAWPWLGYASMTRSTFGAGPVAIVGENARGIDIGLETFFFFKGQEIVIEYDAEIRAGSLWFCVDRPF